MRLYHDDKFISNQNQQKTTNVMIETATSVAGHSCLVRQILTIHRHFSSISTASKVPVRALFLGRGASDQLVGGIE
ncbi:hypothetical protein NC653_027022 [Populus alba x Populus x berolinensis]|uniref:Uncharacterized protein n=1 Tax=Populus alba x Populus x berolinensis TaxID=444605 RepID=A0AAD6Q5L8_9ROSI|nr:hypothetical protein NC653_027022 [Populus alba x Populus x berolinensis]